MLLTGLALMQILALGDSYTIGEAVAEEERWPAQLAGELAARGIRVGAPLIIARTGWTTDELDAAITERDPRGPFDMVTLLVGVNNQYRDRDIENYRSEFGALLERAINFAGGEAGRVVVLSIPDWGVTPFAEGRDRAGIAAAIDAYNRVNREESRRRGAGYVDITGISREAARDPSLTASDGLHPSPAMYHRWTQLVLPLALEILAGSKEKE